MWNGAANTYNGSVTLTKVLGGTATGYTLDIILNNATDWNVTPKIQLALTTTSQGGGGEVGVPEPASLALLAAGIAGLGLMRRRRNADR